MFAFPPCSLFPIEEFSSAWCCDALWCNKPAINQGENLLQATVLSPVVPIGVWSIGCDTPKCFSAHVSLAKDRPASDVADVWKAGPRYEDVMLRQNDSLIDFDSCSCITFLTVLCTVPVWVSLFFGLTVFLCKCWIINLFCFNFARWSSMRVSLNVVWRFHAVLCTSDKKFWQNGCWSVEEICLGDCRKLNLHSKTRSTLNYASLSSVTWNAIWWYWRVDHDNNKMNITQMDTSQRAFDSLTSNR